VKSPTWKVGGAEVLNDLTPGMYAGAGGAEGEEAGVVEEVNADETLD
jgi:hypothetical protein